MKKKYGILNEKILLLTSILIFISLILNTYCDITDTGTGDFLSFDCQIEEASAQFTIDNRSSYTIAHLFLKDYNDVNGTTNLNRLQAPLAPYETYRIENLPLTDSMDLECSNDEYTVRWVQNNVEIKGCRYTWTIYDE